MAEGSNLSCSAFRRHVKGPDLLKSAGRGQRSDLHVLLHGAPSFVAYTLTTSQTMVFHNEFMMAQKNVRTHLGGP